MTRDLLRAFYSNCHHRGEVGIRCMLSSSRIHLARERAGIRALGRGTFSGDSDGAAGRVADIVAFCARVCERPLTHGWWRYCGPLEDERIATLEQVQ